MSEVLFKIGAVVTFLGLLVVAVGLPLMLMSAIIDVLRGGK